MTAAQTSNDTIALAFWRGRLANIVLVFEPIPTDDYNVTTVERRRSEKRLRQWEDEDESYVPTEPYQRNPFLNVVSLT